MAAAARIDRLVHHATMIALKGKSYRLRERGTGVVQAARARPDRPARPSGGATAWGLWTALRPAHITTGPTASWSAIQFLTTALFQFLLTSDFDEGGRVVRERGMTAPGPTPGILVAAHSARR
jgi:hypothetical protein